jgi:GMP synthase-like glutamine amidotransferase
MKILVLEHESDVPPRLLADWASTRGHQLELVAVPQLEQWPDPSESDAIVSLGSDKSVHASPDPWIGRELEFLAAAHAAGTPTLGICFGGQALAKALGGQVNRAPREEIGWAEVASAKPELITPGPWFRWHNDRFTLPPGARLLAGTDGQPDAFVSGRSIGVQIHPEVDQGLAERWITGGRAKLVQQGFDPSELLREVARGAVGARERALDLFDRIWAWQD